MLTSSDPDKLNSTSCNSSLTIQMEASEQSFHMVLSGFSIEGGTRRLIAAYFGIYSRLLCV